MLIVSLILVVAGIATTAYAWREDNLWLLTLGGFLIGFFGMELFNQLNSL